MDANWEGKEKLENLETANVKDENDLFNNSMEGVISPSLAEPILERVEWPEAVKEEGEDKQQVEGVPFSDANDNTGAVFAVDRNPELPNRSSQLGKPQKAGVFENEPIPPLPPSHRLRPPIPSSSFCFVCVTQLPETMLMVTKVDCVILLKDMLGFNEGESHYYLNQLGEPENWIGLCNHCRHWINSAVIVKEQISELQMQLKSFQRQILEKIKRTTLDTNKVRKKHYVQREQRIAVDNILRIVEARNYRSVLPHRHPNPNKGPYKPKRRMVLQKKKKERKVCPRAHSSKSSLSNSKPGFHPATSIILSATSVETRKEVPSHQTSIKKSSNRKQKQTLSLQLPRIQRIQYYACNTCSDDKIFTSREELQLHNTAMHCRHPPSRALSRNFSPERKKFRDSSEEGVSIGPEFKGKLKEDDTLFAKVPRKMGRPDDVKVKYDCPTCPAVKNYEINRFAQHLAIHQRNPFQCTECSAFLPAAEDIQNQHWRENHSNVALPSTSTSSHLPDKFVKVKLDPGWIWKCDACTTGFVSEEARESHEMSCSILLQNKNNPRSTSSASSSPATVYSCSICKNHFRNREEWRLHRVLHHPEVDRFSCPYCDLSFAMKTKEEVEHRNDQKLSEHIQMDHKTLLFQKRNFYECEPCGLVFMKDEETREHFREIHQVPDGGHIFFCKMCPASYANKNNLNIHSKAHFPKYAEADIHCDMCSSEFPTPKLLSEHKLVDHGSKLPEGIKVWNCSKEGCSGFQSIFKGRLDAHSREEHCPKFVCRHCGKVFVDERKLKPHELTHETKTRAKRFCQVAQVSQTCYICCLTYSKLDSFYEHNFQEHGIIPPESSEVLSCSVEGCDFKSLIRQVIEEHSQEVHEVYGKHTCKHCGKK